MMARGKASQNIQAVSIGLADREITVLRLERVGDDLRVNCTRKTWRKSARDLGSDQGKAELAATLTELVSEQKLQGVPLQLALSSDFCVTRVISGENELVQRELQELCERSRVYLSLGVGEKTYAISEAAIDARRKHVWVTVANLRVVANIFDAFRDAKLQLVQVEHSLAALSRVVRAVNVDAGSPVLALDVSQRVVDVGICFKGELLLDYRPSGANAKDSTGTIITRHTKRLQRYLDRLLKRESATINHICLCGDVPDIGQVKAQLEEKTEMTVQLLDPSMAAGDWQLDDEVAHDHRLTGAFGLLLAQSARNQAHQYPNLLDPLHQAHRGPMVRQILRLAWPVVGTVVASVALAAVSFIKHWDCGSQQAELAALEVAANQVQDLQRELQAVELRTAQLRRIQQQLPEPGWERLMSVVGSSLPRGVWLNAFQADRVGEVTISGTSHTQDGVFEFVRHLKEIPNLSSVALESTSQTLLGTGPAVQFVVKAASKAQIETAKTAKVPRTKPERSARSDAEDLVERLQRAGVLIRGEVILR